MDEFTNDIKVTFTNSKAKFHGPSEKVVCVIETLRSMYSGTLYKIFDLGSIKKTP